MSEWTEWIDYQSAWAIFGAGISQAHDIKLLDTDLSEDNIHYTPEHQLVIIDYGGLEVIDYPKDWEKIPKGLMSLFRWLDTSLIAAFRFGYIQYGGYTAELIFDCFREKYNLNSFRDMEGIVYNSLNLGSEPSGVVEEYISWKELRSRLPYGSLLDTMNISQLNQWRSERNKLLGKLFNNQKKVKKIFACELYHERDYVEALANEYHYKKHLIVALRSGNLYGILEALLNLYGICMLKFEYTKAFGLLYFYEKLQNQYSDQVWEKGIEYFESAKQQMFKYISAQDKESFSQLKDMWDIFHYMWCLDDLEHGNISKE